MKLVSNTGPIIALAKVSKLALLKQIASEVLIPVTVHRELFAKLGEESEIIEQAIADFIQIVEVRNKAIDPKVENVLTNLDEGEKQTIALASTLTEQSILLLDDRAGRQAAQEVGLPKTGSIGILLRLKEKGLIEEVGVLLLEMREQGYWLSDKVIEVAKQLAMEDD